MYMKLRIRNKWRNKDRQGSLEDNAIALAYIIWQIGLTAAKNLHAEDFEYDSDQQRTHVIAEYLIFLAHVVDRLSYEAMDEQTRQAFVHTLAQDIARHYQRNLEDIVCRGDYRTAFVKMMNERFAEYADTTFDSDGPGYEARRCLGEKIQNVMGMSQTNKWVIQQVMDLDAPEAVKHLRQGMDNLFGTSNVDVLRHAEKGSVVGPD